MGITQDIGNACERIAERFFLDRGFTLVQRNYRTKRGEIDLILEKDSVLLFVEVKGRSEDWEPSAWETAWRGKRRRLRSATRQFLAERPEYFDRADEFAWEIVFVSRGRVVSRFMD